MKRILILILSIFMLSSVFALNDSQVYYSFDESKVSSSTMIDISSNGNNGTCNNMGGDCNTITGLLINASDFDGSDDYINSGSDTSLDNIFDSEGTINLWFNADSDGELNTGRIMEKTRWAVRTTSESGGQIKIQFFQTFSLSNGVWETTSRYNLNQWNMLTIKYDSSSSVNNPTIYINGVSVAVTETNTPSGIRNDDSAFNLLIGSNGATTESYDGSLDEVSIYNRALNSTEISDIYNNGTGYNPYTETAEKLTTNLSTYYNRSNITILINSTVSTNLSYIIDGGNETSLCSSCTSYELNLTGLSEGLHNISFISLETSLNETFTIDLTAPNISIIGPITQDFLVNFSEVFNVTDSLSGLASCYLNATYLENVTNASQYNEYVNCTDSVTFGAAGLYNGYLVATDNAGNVETLNINGTIEPFIYINFQNIYGQNITNYDVYIYHPNVSHTEELTGLNNPVNISPYHEEELDLGNYTFQVTKEGYVVENFTISINETSGGETYNFNLTLVTLTIKTYDINSLEQINFNITIENSTDSQTYLNQFNFSKLYNETPTGDITLTISANTYDDSEYLLTLNPYTSINLDTYLYSTNSTAVHQFTVLETSSGLALSGVDIEIQQEINNSWTTIGAKTTGSNGKTYFYLSTAEEYKVIFSKDDYVTATSNTIPTVKEYTVKLSSTAGTYEYVDDISYSFKPTATLLNDNNTYSFQSFISGSSFTNIEFDIILSNGTTIYSDSSSNPTGTTFSYDYYLPYQVNLSGVTLQLTYYSDGNTEVITRDYTIISFTNTSFLSTLEEYSENPNEESKLTIWFLLMGGTAALLIGGALIGFNSISLLVIPFWAFASFVGWVDWVLAGVVIFISLIISLGGRK